MQQNVKGKTIWIAGSGADKYMWHFESKEAAEYAKEHQGVYGKLREVELYEELTTVLQEKLTGLSQSLPISEQVVDTEVKKLSSLVCDLCRELNFKTQPSAINKTPFFKWSDGNNPGDWRWVIKRKDGSVAWESDWLTVATVNV